MLSKFSILNFETQKKENRRASAMGGKMERMRAYGWQMRMGIQGVECRAARLT